MNATAAHSPQLHSDIKLWVIVPDFSQNNKWMHGEECDEIRVMPFTRESVSQNTGRTPEY